MELKNIRISKGLTQVRAAKILGVSRRTYIKYENGEANLPEIKYNFLCRTLEEYGRIDEEHGLLTVERIREVCSRVFEEYGVEYGYLDAIGISKETMLFELECFEKYGTYK